MKNKERRAFGLELIRPVCRASSDYGNVIQRWEKAIVPMTGEIDNLRYMCMCEHTNTHTQQGGRAGDNSAVSLCIRGRVTNRFMVGII